jgi:hypothetical protein
MGNLRNIVYIVFILGLLWNNNLCNAQDLSPIYYDIGSPSLTDVYVDPVNGNDSNSGNSRSSALKTLTAAWNDIPQGQSLSLGVRINILSGSIPESAIPNYMESRYGTFSAPIIIRAIDGAGTVTLLGDLNVYDTKYLYLIDLKIAPSGDTFHCEKCDHILIRGGEYNGGNRQAHETIKINQSQYIYIENSNIHGADDNAIDFVAVQYGHIIYSKIHNAQDWCAYVKGGSAYLRIEGNQFYDCGTGGFTAGQGTGFEFMTSPWLHYEAYDIKFINNIIHDTEGAGFGINGGYNILAAFNTLYKVGSRSHTIEVVYGLRSCDGNASRCNSYLSSGGWGTTSTGTEGEPIGNKNVYIYNNIIYNPSSFNSPSEIFAIYGPRTPSGGTNLSSPQVTDQNLKIKGNIVWINSGSSSIGIESDSAGCQPSNATCTQIQILSDNSINTFEPSLTSPSALDFRPTESGNVFSVVPVSIPAFIGGDRPSTPASTEGVLSNSFTRDRGNTERSSNSAVGAYANWNSIIAPPGSGGSDNDSAPVISKASCTPKNARVGKTIKCTVKASDDKKISSVTVKIGKKISKRLKKVKGIYQVSFKAVKVKSSGSVVVKDNGGNSKTKSLGKFNFR